jgi:hypothetical protein
MRFIENTKSAIVLYVLFHCTRGECNGTRSIALLGNGIFYSISRDHKQPIKRLEFNKVLYKHLYPIRLKKYSDSWQVVPKFSFL